jgi:hypothetical protein
MLQHTELPLTDLPPLSDEERQGMRVTLDLLHTFRTRLLAGRGGRIFPDCGREVAELRAEHDEESL